MTFKEWFLKESSFTTYAKLGLYAPIDDDLGQYPPLYGIPRAADLINYISIAYNGGVPPGENGIIRYTNNDPRIRKAK